MSSLSSRKMLISDLGSATPGRTENDKPIAWPGVGYGSCPTIRTFTLSNGYVNARSTSVPAGR